MLTGQDKNYQQDKYVIFTIGQERFGIDIMAVSEIEDGKDFEAVSDDLPNLLGTVLIRDVKVPVFSLANKFNLPKAEDHKDLKQRIITRSNNLLVAFEVDEIKGVEEITKENIYEVPKLIQPNGSGYMKGIAKKDSDITILLDESKLIGEKEYKEIQAIMNS